MKLLVAIPSNHPKKLATIMWASRAGFDLRIFMPEGVKKARYNNVIEDANYQEFLDLRHSMLVKGAQPLSYAQEKGYDLLAVIPPNLRRWNDNRNRDEMVIEYQTDLARARKQIGEDTKLHEVTFENGARVVRVVKI